MQPRTIQPSPSDALANARALRAASTVAEQRLWYRLRAGRLSGLKFRRQHPIPPCIADFCCVSARLIVELDGSQHGGMVDSERVAYVRGQGFKVMRFWNNDVLQRTEAVLEEILQAAQERTLTPDPSPIGRGE